jgi:hypothetical protein
MFWSHSCLHSRLLNRIPFWVSWPLMCTVSQSHRGWSILSIPTTNCSKRLVCCTCCHMLSRKQFISWNKCHLSGSSGSSLVRSRSKFWERWNLHPCYLSIYLGSTFPRLTFLQTHFFVESKGSCFNCFLLEWTLGLGLLDGYFWCYVISSNLWVQGNVVGVPKQTNRCLWSLWCHKWFHFFKFCSYLISIRIASLRKCFRRRDACVQRSLGGWGIKVCTAVDTTGPP